MRTPEERRLNPWTDAQCLDSIRKYWADRGSPVEVERKNVFIGLDKNGRAVYHSETVSNLRNGLPTKGN